jgi:hypothetical protein
MLLPNEIDPVAAGADMPLPRPKAPMVEAAKTDKMPEKAEAAAKKSKAGTHVSSRFNKQRRKRRR